jgi:rRNA maturation protein Rpf1
MVHEHRGEPDGLIVCHLPFGPTAYFGLLNVVSGILSSLQKYQVKPTNNQMHLHAWRLIIPLL